MERGEGKIATGRFRINMAGSNDGRFFSGEVNNATNEVKLAFSCIGNNVP